MQRHILLILLRALLAAAVIYVLPYSHIKWGEPYPGDGQQAFGMVIAFTLIGAGFALLYFAVGAVVQFFLRRKSWRWTAIADATMFVLLAGLLTYGGITAHYVDNVEQSDLPKPRSSSISMDDSVIAAR